MAALYEDIGFRKVVFLRFNPDGYTVGIQKYKSPFGYTPTGIIKINGPEKKVLVWFPVLNIVPLSET
jgi:hypothetical protein